MPRCEPGQLARAAAYILRQFRFVAGLLLFEINAFVLAAVDGGAYLRWVLPTWSADMRRSPLWRRRHIECCAWSHSNCAGWCGPGRGRNGTSRKLVDHAADLDRLLIGVYLHG